MSDAKLVVVIVLLMVLSAGASISLTWFPQVSTAGHGRALEHEGGNPQFAGRLAVSGFWGWVGTGANPEMILAYGLNLILTVLVIALLRRNGRYRQTLFAKAFRSSPLSITISTLADGR